MRYAIARHNTNRRDVAYRIYVSDCLRMICENTAKYGGGSYVTKRLADVVYRKQDNRTGEEIAADIIKRAGLVVIE